VLDCKVCRIARPALYNSESRARTQCGLRPRIPSFRERAMAACGSFFTVDVTVDGELLTWGKCKE
jgi:hypothetical protein